MTTPPLDPMYAKFMQLYPPYVYNEMSPDARAFAWAKFVEDQRREATELANFMQAEASRDSLQATLVAIFVLIPLIIGLIVFIVMGASGKL